MTTHAGFEVTGLRFYLRLQFLEVLKLHFALDVAFDGRDVTLHAAKQMPGGTSNPWQAFWANHDQRNHADDHQLGEAKIKHSRRSLAYGRARNSGYAAGADGHWRVWMC